MNKIVVFVETIKYLKFKQVFYRGYYFLRRGGSTNDINLNEKKESRELKLVDSISSYPSFDKNTFLFLNESHSFGNSIDWNYKEKGMLWAYNLNYFEFLQQDVISVEDGLALIRDYISKKDQILVGYDPYPISLRNIFWIRFLTEHKIKDEEINSFIYGSYKILLKKLEYHLLGNHLLENGYSLLVGAYYFQSEELYKVAYEIMIEELKEQVLNDGAHFELSPMYHQVLLYRLLDCLNVVQNNQWKKDKLLSLMLSKAGDMCAWLENMTLPSGDIPLFNDAANGIAPSSAKIFAYAERLGVKRSKQKLGDSNYRLFEDGQRYKCVMDVEGIAPIYQPGHANADTFSFVLEVNSKPLLVDTGCSTYEAGAIRSFERGTSSHNTVVVNDSNSSDVWASHRVGKRAKVKLITDQANLIKAEHNGYKHLGVTHVRTYEQRNNAIEITDEVAGSVATSNKAYFHLDYHIEGVSLSENEVHISEHKLLFDGASNIALIEYEQALGFNKREIAKCICVTFDKVLKTQIVINP